MSILPVIFATIISTPGWLSSDEPVQESATPDKIFDRLDVDGDGRVTLDEAPQQGKMLVEFLLLQSGKNNADVIDRNEFKRLAGRYSDQHPTGHRPDENAVAAALEISGVQAAPENCPACAMGLTAEFVFKRLDVDEDKLVSATEFRRSPGMQDESKARDVVGRLDTNNDGQLSWTELETAYQARHANCQKPDPAALATKTEAVRRDGRGDGSRFAQVFIMRSDENGDGKVSKEEFRGPAFGFDRLDKNKNGFIEADELGDLHQRRLNDPKSMKERLESGDVPSPPQDKRPKGLGDSETKTSGHNG